MMMFNWIRNRGQDRAKAQELYGAVVTLARRPGFYSHFGVPDTPEGRFEMVALALFLVLERLKGLPGTGTLMRGTIEAFVSDMDDCMREMGVGDVIVGKKVKRAAAAFYERAGAYRSPITAGDAAALAQALEGHIFSGRGGGSELALRLAKCVLSLNVALAAAPDRDVLTGEALTSMAVPERAG